MIYLDLKNDIALWSGRGDLTALIPSFVRLAEMEIYRTNPNPLRVSEMETEATLTVSALTATLPSDFLDARSLKLDDASSTLLAYVPPSEWNQSRAGVFTIVGDQVRLPEGTSSNLKLAYYAQPSALSENTDTNAVLSNYYGIYLNAAMIFAMVYVLDMGAAQVYREQLSVAIDAATRNNKSNFSGPLVVRAA